MNLKSQKRTFKLNDLEFIVMLLKMNYPLNLCLSLILNNVNKKIINTILKKLNEGEYIETIIKDYLKKDIRKIFIVFIEHLSFTNALELSLKLNEEKRKLKKLILDNSLYPLILFISSFILFYLFIFFFSDNLLNIMDNLKLESSFFRNLFLIIKLILNFLLIALLLVLILISYLHKYKLIPSYKYLALKISNNPLVKYESYRFINYYQIALNSDLNTKDIIELFKNLKDDKLLSYISTKIDKNYLSGKNFIESMSLKILDPILLNYLKLSYQVKDNKKVLKDYLEFSKQNFIKMIKKITLYLKVIIYLFLALLIYFMYYLMLLPMEVINQI